LNTNGKGKKGPPPLRHNQHWKNQKKVHTPRQEEEKSHHRGGKEGKERASGALSLLAKSQTCTPSALERKKKRNTVPFPPVNTPKSMLDATWRQRRKKGKSTLIGITYARAKHLSLHILKKKGLFSPEKRGNKPRGGEKKRILSSNSTGGGKGKSPTPPVLYHHVKEKEKKCTAKLDQKGRLIAYRWVGLGFVGWGVFFFGGCWGGGCHVANNLRDSYYDKRRYVPRGKKPGKKKGNALFIG